VYGNDQRGHDLLELFDALPVEAREALCQELSKAQSKNGITELGAFRTEIERVRHAFVEWRYLHERTRACEIRFVELIFVLNVLHNTCRVDPRLKPPVPGAESSARL
jgi:hypothetical protein